MSDQTTVSNLVAQDRFAFHDSEPPCKRVRTSTPAYKPNKDLSPGLNKPMFLQASKTALGQISPPISPQADLQDKIALNHTQNSDDLILYPDDPLQVDTDEKFLSSLEGLPSAQPEQCINLETQSADIKVEQHQNLFMPFNATPRSSFRSKVGGLYNRNSGGLLNYLRDERIRESSSNISLPKTSRENPTIRQSNQPVRAKTRHTAQRVRPGKVVKLVVVETTRKQSQSLDALKSTDAKTSRKRVEDTDFEILPNLCPPFSLLANPKALRADWQGNPLDLSADPNRHLLDDRELSLASSLRLSCATYLCSKRRIFLGRVESLRVGKEFRKTDAQQACKIDVNKASKLWAAFDNGGWFEPELFHDFVQ